MNATTALLRSLVRICGAQGAIVTAGAGQSVLATYGAISHASAQGLIARPDGSAMPDGLRIVLTVAIPHAGCDTSAKLHVLDRAPAANDPAALHAVAVLAGEIGYQLGRPAEASLAHVADGIDALNDAALIMDLPPAGTQPRILYVNAAFESLLGYDAAAAIGQTSDFLHGPSTDRHRIDYMNERVRTMSEARIPIVYYRRDGVPIWIELSMRRIPGSLEGAPAIVATLRDVSTRKEFEFALAKEKRKLQVTLAAIGDGVITTVADGRIDYVNLAAREMLDIDAAEAYGEPIGQIVPLTDGNGAPIDLTAPPPEPGGVSRGQAQFGRFPGHKHLAFVSSPIGDEGHVVVLRDVTAQQRLSTQLSYEASHDPLTGIYNRRKFEQLLDLAIASTQCNAGPHVLAYLDLDRFKVINDSCGHGVGDRVLLDVAHLLQSQLRLGDALARIGGDEFAVLLYDCDLDDARRILDMLRLAVEAYRIVDDGREYGVGVSIGMTAIDGTEAQPRAIVARADAACYAAKSRGRNAIAG